MKRNMVLILTFLFLLLLSACGKGAEIAAGTGDISESEERRFEIRKRIHDDMPEFLFVASGVCVEEEHDVQVHVYNENGDAVFSVITSVFLDFEIIHESNPFGFYVTDLNFDGYRDLLLVQSRGGVKGNMFYCCWLWDNDSGAFVENRSFSEIINPAIDRNNERILSFDSMSAGTQNFEMYEFRNGIFELTNSLLFDRENEFIDNEERILWLNITEEALVNGELTVINSMRIIDEDTETLAADYVSQGSFWEAYGDKWFRSDY